MSRVRPSGGFAVVVASDGLVHRLHRWGLDGWTGFSRFCGEELSHYVPDGGRGWLFPTYRLCRIAEPNERVNCVLCAGGYAL